MPSPKTNRKKKGIKRGELKDWADDRNSLTAILNAKLIYRLTSMIRPADVALRRFDSGSGCISV
jgi:hypothetical protein